MEALLGNLLACAVARAALRVIKEESIIENAATIGNYFLKKLSEIKSFYVKEVRGPSFSEAAANVAISAVWTEGITIFAKNSFDVQFISRHVHTQKGRCH